jgi:hypothetical protein
LPSKERSAAYNFVYDKFKSKLASYKANRLSHAARLTLIKSVFSSIPVYYMSNILFSKKFLSKLTAIIRNFWWTGVRDDQTTKSLCLRAWADDCIAKNIGGLGVRNLQALNQGLILSAAWRLAKEPQSQIAQILKAKYHHDTSIWRAKPDKPKSAFWAAILKVKPLLVSASICQIVDGSSSIWSSPWFLGWEDIYDHLVIQDQPFSYPATVKDLWIPGQKQWNASLINSLFTSQTANAILQTPIINASGQDTLVWTLTPAGNWSSKSAYRHCFNNLQLPPRQRPKIVPQETIALLNQVWQDKQMAPRIQTFAWRLLRRALPTGKRASKFSQHIKENCSQCGNVEDEMHMLFLCPFSKAAWFSSPWYIKTELIAANHHSVPDMIQYLINSRHPHINTTSLYTFLWCLWKARNNALFCRKRCSPYQVFAAANAIIQGTKLEDANSFQDRNSTEASSDDTIQLQVASVQHMTPSPGATVRNIATISGSIIFSDAAWSPGLDGQPAPAGLGIFMQICGDRTCSQICISAISPPASSAIQAEAFGLLLASQLVELLHIQQPTYLTDNATLATAAAAQDLHLAPGHWTIRPQLAHMAAISSFDASKVFHISRSNNFRAHHHARLALKLQNRPFSFRCLRTDNRACLNAGVTSMSCVSQCTLVFVRCC